MWPQKTDQQGKQTSRWKVGRERDRREEMTGNRESGKARAKRDNQRTGKKQKRQPAVREVSEPST